MVSALFAYYLAFYTYYDLTMTGMICAAGERLVEGLVPGIFDRFGNDAECVPNSKMSEIAEWLNHARPRLLAWSSRVTTCLCVVTL